MDPATIFFYFLATILVIFAYKTITAANPIHSALYLAVTMVGLAFMFFSLKADFIGGVQLVVYAGAVMVLFVMVVMLFDLKHEVNVFSRGVFSGLLKVTSVGFLCGILSFAIIMSTELISPTSSSNAVIIEDSTSKDLAMLLFSQYLFAFEALGLLLLLVAVGVVAISRIKGGTHVKS